MTRGFATTLRQITGGGAPALPVALHCVAGVWPRNVRVRRPVQYAGAVAFLLASLLAYLASSRRLDIPAPAPTLAAATSATPGEAPIIAGVQRRPHLWVLSVGVGAYRDERLRLQYAAADAESLADALRRLEHSPLYDTVHTKVLVDGEATRERILEALESFLGDAGPAGVL